MKTLLFSLFTIVASTGLFAQKSDDLAKFNQETINLGTMKQNSPTTGVFTVKNISSKDLIIANVQPTCGCTVADYTKTPIKPGKTGTITATYNAATPGNVDKHMNVQFAGATDTKSIGFKGEVLSEEDYNKWAATNTPAKTKTTAVSTTKKTTKAKS